MDYEKKYKEALERARKIHHETEFDYEKGMMEEIFPEIKDSEDERIYRKKGMIQNEKELIKWFFYLVGYFNHYEFFTKRLWKKVKGFEREDEAEIKCMFMHYWFHHKFGYYTCPCGSSWFTIVDRNSYNNYITNYKPVLDFFVTWVTDQR